MSHRNEPARERRRQVLKEQLSIRSIPLMEPPKELYNLDNHFGWKVLQRCKIGDGSFPPYLLHCVYCDKPDVPSQRDGGDYDKVMYVLYIRGKDGDLEPVDVKETQTVFSTTSMPPRIMAAPPPPAEKPKKVKHARRKSSDRPQHTNKRVIGDFYYIPIKDRINERYDIRPPSVSGSGGDIAGKSKGKKSKKGEKARSTPKSWQLRAGAESPDENEGMGDTSDTDLSSESETEEEELDEEEVEEEEGGQNKFIDSLKKYDCTNCFNRSPTNAELMESPLEKNRYLYLPKERYGKRPASPRPTSDRPTSARLTSPSPTSGRQTSSLPTSPRPTLAHPTSDRPTSARLTSPRPTSDRPTSGRQTSSLPTSPRPTLARPKSDRPTSDRPTLDRTTSSLPKSSRPTSARPTSATSKRIYINNQDSNQ